MSSRNRRNNRLASDLQAAVNHAGKLIQHGSAIDKMAASTSKKGDRLVLNNGWEIRTKKIDWFGQKKNFYDVYNSRTGKIEAADLGLFVAAVALIKMKSNSKHAKDVRRVLDVDVRYQQNLTDAAIFGIRLRSKKISSARSDILKIRMEEAMLRCQSAKKEIRSLV